MLISRRRASNDLFLPVSVAILLTDRHGSLEVIGDILKDLAKSVSAQKRCGSQDLAATPNFRAVTLTEL